jgi:hypothetical protein
MFHPIDTGPFKLVVLQPTDSMKVHPAIPIFETGARLSGGIEHTIFGGASAAFDPSRPLSLRTGNGSSCPEADLAGAIGERRGRVRTCLSFFPIDWSRHAKSEPNAPALDDLPRSSVQMCRTS